MDGLLDPSKYNPIGEIKMTDGINLTGFNETKAGAKNNLDLNPTGTQPAAAFPATDVSSQDGAGLGNNGK